MSDPTVTKEMTIDTFFSIGYDDLSEMLRAVVEMQKMLSGKGFSDLSESLEKASIAIGNAKVSMYGELIKVSPTLDEELAELEMADKHKRVQKETKKELKKDIQRPLTQAEEFEKRNEEMKKFHEEGLKNKTPLSPLKQLKPKQIMNMGKTMDTDTLLALADKLDEAGEEAKANIIDELIKKIASEEKETTRVEQNTSVFEKLAGIADTLDAIGALEEATLIDEFIEKHAAAAKDKKKDDYDSDKHRDEQIIERNDPVKKEDIAKKHHVKPYEYVGSASLSTRHCPIHVGVMMGRISDNTYQCPLDGEVYNWETGWVDYEGTKHPGGSVSAQTPSATEYAIPHRIFDPKDKVF